MRVLVRRCKQACRNARKREDVTATWCFRHPPQLRWTGCATRFEERVETFRIPFDCETAQGPSHDACHDPQKLLIRAWPRGRPTRPPSDETSRFHRRGRRTSATMDGSRATTIRPHSIKLRRKTQSPSRPLLGDILISRSIFRTQSLICSAANSDSIQKESRAHTVIGDHGPYIDINSDKVSVSR